MQPHATLHPSAAGRSPGLGYLESQTSPLDLMIGGMGICGSRTVPFSYAANRPLSRVVVSANSGWVSHPTLTDQARHDLTLTVPRDGHYEIAVTATDRNGQSQTKHASVLVDAASPVVHAVLLANVVRGEAALSITAQAGGWSISQGMAIITCRRPDGTTRSELASMEGGALYRRLGQEHLREGLNLVEVEVTDQRGLTGGTSVVVLVDQTAPLLRQPRVQIKGRAGQVDCELGEDAKVALYSRQPGCGWMQTYTSGVNFLPAGPFRQTVILPGPGTWLTLIAARDRAGNQSLYYA